MRCGKSVILAHALSYARRAYPAENWTASAPRADPSRLRVWASVHTCHSSHQTHVHPHGALSGVYYVHVPPSAGLLTLFDPRGVHAAPPFGITTVEHAPSAGDVVAFPPWLPHAVSPSRRACLT